MRPVRSTRPVQARWRPVQARWHPAQPRPVRVRWRPVQKRPVQVRWRPAQKRPAQAQIPGFPTLRIQGPQTPVHPAPARLVPYPQVQVLRGRQGRPVRYPQAQARQVRRVHVLQAHLAPDPPARQGRQVRQVPGRPARLVHRVPGRRVPRGYQARPVPDR
jgi:hypothetical protein